MLLVFEMRHSIVLFYFLIQSIIRRGYVNLVGFAFISVGPHKVSIVV